MMPLDDLGNLSAITYLLTLLPGIYSGLKPSGFVTLKLLSSLVARKRKILGITCFILGLVHGLHEIYDAGGLAAFRECAADYWSGISILALWFPLAITSNKVSMQKLGKNNWQRLHYLTYISLPLVGIHTYLKGDNLSCMHALISAAVVVLILLQFFRFSKTQKFSEKKRGFLEFLGLNESRGKQDVESEAQLNSMVQPFKDLQKR